MATFPPFIPDFDTGRIAYALSFLNHSNSEINYDIRDISGDAQNYGNIAPGAGAVSNEFWTDSLLQYGNVPVVGIGQFGHTQLVPVPGVRFWSGFNFPQEDQYINLLAGNGYTVTRDSPLISEVTGNDFRITVDGGGNQQTTVTIFFQVYNA